MPRVPDRPDARLRLEGRRIVHGNTSHEIRVKSSFTYGFKLRQCYLWGNIIKHYFHSHPDTNILRFAAYYIGHHLYPLLLSIPNPETYKLGKVHVDKRKPCHISYTLVKRTHAFCKRPNKAWSPDEILAEAFHNRHF